MSSKLLNNRKGYPGCMALLGKARYQKNYQELWMPLIILPVIHSNLNISEISWKKPRMVGIALRSPV
jgi:hypothetical protein